METYDLTIPEQVVLNVQDNIKDVLGDISSSLSSDHHQYTREELINILNGLIFDLEVEVRVLEKIGPEAAISNVSEEYRGKSSLRN